MHQFDIQIKLAILENVNLLIMEKKEEKKSKKTSLVRPILSPQTWTARMSDQKIIRSHLNQLPALT